MTVSGFPSASPDVPAYLAALPEVTASLLTEADELNDRTVQEPSTLPRWSRGHVLTHLARNAEGSVRLLEWARTGQRQDEYVNMDIRERDIEAGARRPVRDLVDDVRYWSETLSATAEGLDDARWQETIQWAAGEYTRAAVIPVARLGEVLLHHTDLGIGFEPSRWPSHLLPDLFDRYLSLTKVPAPVPFELRDTDSGRQWTVGSGSVNNVVSGPAPWLLGWLTRRSSGQHLSIDPASPLPQLPVLP